MGCAVVPAAAIGPGTLCHLPPPFVLDSHPFPSVLTLARMAGLVK